MQRPEFQHGLLSLPIISEHPVRTHHVPLVCFNAAQIALIAGVTVASKPTNSILANAIDTWISRTIIDITGAQLA